MRLGGAPRSWLRLPRHTARLRLSLVYGGLFLVSGAALLAITYVLFEHATAPNRRPIKAVERLGSSGDSHIPAVPHLAHGLVNPESVGAAQRASDLHQLLVDSGIALAIVAVLALLLGWFVAGRMLRPLRTITTSARRISASNLHERLALDSADEEFKELGDTLDGLFARLEAAFEAQRHFVANASHELRTPLTRERTLVQVALGDPSTSDVWQSTGQELLVSNREQERLIEALLALASSEGGLDRHEPVDLATAVETALTTFRPQVERLGLGVNPALLPALLEGDARLIERLVANLFDNAIGHNVVEGRVDVVTGTRGDRAFLSITNTGPFIPPGEVDRLFQPFQRLDPGRTHDKGGHGLGLSIVRAIASAHGATISAEPAPGGGLAVTVAFPARTNALRSGQGSVASNRLAEA